MKIFEKRLVETVVDRVCDVCNESVMADVGGDRVEKFGELKAKWGYGSKEDGNDYHLDLCESCFKVALSALKDHKRLIFMFDDENNLPDEKFGVNLDRG
ncbi:hypothetical protein [Pseudoalteromonas sp.]|uniref:hypothetical protein n=1 Tax=Pseudoalteromonas sp. TaxID=53249 RepID=UPI00263781CC|nr:hypothetical protein [Pseudoalteromonas sp.]MCP3861815.1 hypothetical protein [Aestuariibacter sp.]MCP4587694.1 hypothetical protein [Pseudoalteromonas sp.]